MKKLTESILRDAEAAAQALGNVPKDKEDDVARLAGAYAAGIRVGMRLEKTDKEEKQPA